MQTFRAAGDQVGLRRMEEGGSAVTAREGGNLSTTGQIPHRHAFIAR